MTELPALLAEALLRATFRTTEGTVYSTEEFRDALARTSGRLRDTCCVKWRADVGQDNGKRAADWPVGKSLSQFVTTA